MLYAAAAAAVETRLLASALRAQHDLIAARLVELLRADNSAGIAALAHALIGLLQVCHLIHPVTALNRAPGTARDRHCRFRPRRGSAAEPVA